MAQKKKMDPAGRVGKTAPRAAPAAKKGEKKLAVARQGAAARQAARPPKKAQASKSAVKARPARAPAKPIAAAKPAAKAGPAADKRHASKPAVAPPAKAVAAKQAAGHGPIRSGAVPPRAPMAPIQTRTMPASVGKTAGQKITAPVSTPPASPKDIAARAAAARPMMAAQKKSVSQRHGFKTNEFVVYPAHGVGRIVGIEEQEIAGMSLELFVINFEKEKLTLRVPTSKLQSVGMRKLADEEVVRKAMETLKGRARVKRTMWSRRAQEYVAKINSGDLVSIAEVVRDLYRSEAQPEQSYSERQLYEDALDRMAREIAAVEKLDERGAVQRITEVLSKSARGRRIAEGTEVEAAA
jgi:CarD family transcriptional regulator